MESSIGMKILDVNNDLPSHNIAIEKFFAISRNLFFRNFETRNRRWMSKNEIWRNCASRIKDAPFNSASTNLKLFGLNSPTRRYFWFKRVLPIFCDFWFFVRFFDILTWRQNAKITILTTAAKKGILYWMMKKLWNSNYSFGSYDPSKCQNLPKKQNYKIILRLT